MRPLYESPADLANEADVVKLLERKWDCVMHKLPISYKLDYIAQTDIAKAFVEVKVRNYTMTQLGNMGGYMLSLHKWTAGVQLSQTTGLPFVLVVKTLDGVYYLSVDPSMTLGMIHNLGKVKMGGRKDRNDWQDMEPCIHIDTNHFSRMTT